MKKFKDAVVFLLLGAVCVGAIYFSLNYEYRKYRAMKKVESMEVLMSGKSIIGGASIALRYDDQSARNAILEYAESLRNEGKVDECNHIYDKIRQEQIKEGDADAEEYLDD